LEAGEDGELQRPLLLLRLHVAVDDLLVALDVERYRQLGTFNCRDGALAELLVSDSISHCERTDGSRLGLRKRLRKGSFAAGHLRSGAGLFGALGERHGTSPIWFRKVELTLSRQCVEARCNRTGCLLGA
jgi:hypothetical protein